MLGSLSHRERKAFTAALLCAGAIVLILLVIAMIGL
jgi:hypothetical protein